MQTHPESFGVQMAATACLYNLTKGDLATRIHPSILAKVGSIFFFFVDLKSFALMSDRKFIYYVKSVDSKMKWLTN